jgi:hypothetical protein
MRLQINNLKKIMNKINKFNKQFKVKMNNHKFKPNQVWIYLLIKIPLILIFSKENNSNFLK